MYALVFGWLVWSTAIAAIVAVFFILGVRNPGLAAIDVGFSLLYWKITLAYLKRPPRVPSPDRQA